MIKNTRKALTKTVPVCGNIQRADDGGRSAGVDRQGKSLLSCRAEQREFLRKPVLKMKVVGSAGVPPLQG